MQLYQAASVFSNKGSYQAVEETPADWQRIQSLFSFSLLSVLGPQADLHPSSLQVCIQSGLYISIEDRDHSEEPSLGVLGPVAWLLPV